MLCIAAIHLVSARNQNDNNLYLRIYQIVREGAHRQPLDMLRPPTRVMNFPQENSHERFLDALLFSEIPIGPNKGALMRKQEKR
jgi:hypothetical protein